MKKLVEIEGPLVSGIFKTRPNRYVAEVCVEETLHRVHVHDPGRLRELLFPDNPCIIRYAASETRKTDWDMIAAYKPLQNGSEYVLIHSGYHRSIAEALLGDAAVSPFGAYQDLRAEVTFGHSRIDFFMHLANGDPMWVEVKGCSLSENGIAKFPDAPTVRGTKHLKTLMDIKRSGQRAAVILLVFSEADCFQPKADTDPIFAETFYEAQTVGVEIHAVRIILDSLTGTLQFGGEIPIVPR